MSGMMGGGVVDLKTLGPEHHVRAMTFCQDTFRVTTADGNTRAFWERNLRLRSTAAMRVRKRERSR